MLLLLVLETLAFLLFLAGCSVSGEDDSSKEPMETPSATMSDETVVPEDSSSEPEATMEPDEESDAPEILEGVKVSTRTPVPTATPEILIEGVSETKVELGLSRHSIPRRSTYRSTAKPPD